MTNKTLAKRIKDYLKGFYLSHEEREFNYTINYRTLKWRDINAPDTRTSFQKDLDEYLEEQLLHVRDMAKLQFSDKPITLGSREGITYTATRGKP